MQCSVSNINRISLFLKRAQITIPYTKGVQTKSYKNQKQPKNHIIFFTRFENVWNSFKSTGIHLKLESYKKSKSGTLCSGFVNTSNSDADNYCETINEMYSSQKQKGSWE